MDTILEVNTRSGEIERRKATEEELKWGGRLFLSKYMLRETTPLCDPVGRNNKLILSNGLLADTNLTTSGKLSIGGKSPLTGGIKESNVGGTAGKKLARLGIKALILEDIPESNNEPRILYLEKTKAELVEAPELKGKMVDETVEILREKYGSKPGILCIGPAGEKEMFGAGIACTGPKDVQVRFAGRGGLGAVMGSKGIKAIVINDKEIVEPKYADKELFNKAKKEIVDYILNDPKTSHRHNYGTPDIIELANEVGLFPTNNFSSGRFEDAEKFYGERLASVMEERGGEGGTGKPCMNGCIIQCSNVYPDKDGNKIVASLQYENIGLLASNCGIGDPDEVAELNNLVNQVGLDTIETGAALGVAMEAGIIEFGDAEGAKDIIKQVKEGTHLGKIIGNGVVITGKVLGVIRIPAIKGQGIPAYDPRALKGNGVTYVTSPMGADHTAANTFGTMNEVDPLGREGHLENSKKLQIRAALLDLLGVCLFIRPPFVNNPQLFVELLEGKFGWDLTLNDIREFGNDILNSEREFNKKAGVSEEFFDIPEFMREEPLPPNNSVFDISLDKMTEIWEVKLPEKEF